MLNDYKTIEPIVCEQLVNCVNGNLSHAYLFNTNDNIYANEILNAFIKSIICGIHKNKKEYENCNICKRIDDGNYIDISYIYPDGMTIKKEQIDQLQKKFSVKSTEGNRKVYVIYDADKLNLSSANSLLKFLEDPGEDIYGILVTKNINLVLKTISSRCQIINFNKNNVDDFIKFNKIDNNITEYKLMYSVWNDRNIDNIDNYKEFLNYFINFIKYYKDNGVKNLVNIKQYFFDYFDDKEKVIKFFEYMVLFYRDLINYKIDKKVIYFNDYIDLIDSMCNICSAKEILYKLKVIINKEKLIKSNANVNMLIDSMLIEMEYNDECSRNNV